MGIVPLDIRVSADQSKRLEKAFSNHKVTFVFAEYTLLIFNPAKKAPPPKDLTVSLPIKTLSCIFLYFGVPVMKLTGMTICYSSALLFWPTLPYEKRYGVLHGTRLTTLKGPEGQVQPFLSGDDLVQLRNDRLDACS